MNCESNNILMENEDNEIKSLIYTVRNKQVMLDCDVAELYKYKTKSLNLAVKRNISRFPEEFCFKLTERELEDLRFQFETSKDSYKIKTRGGRRYLPYVFTEQGIAMLAGILKSEIAVEMSIKIIKSFIEMRKLLIHNGQLLERLYTIEYKITEYDKKFEYIFNELRAQEQEKQRIFFEGQIYDAYSLIIDFIKKAQKQIILIDNYIDDSVLKMISKKKENVEVYIFTSEKSNILNLDVQKFNKEYPTLKIVKTKKFHDRFILIDKKELYHCGASIKDLGKKCFAINRIEDSDIINQIIMNI